MKISEKTLDVLKNFATINTGLVFKTGNVLRTISKEKNVLARAEVEENFEQDFAIYDLNRFLSVLNSIGSAEIELDKDAKRMRFLDNGKEVADCGLTDSSMVVSPPDKDLSIKNPEVCFTLSKEVFQKVLRMAGVMGLPNITVRGDRKTIYLEAIDVKNPDSDRFFVEVGETSAEFQSVFVTENFKMLPGSYEVEISSKGIALFKGGVDYWIATEAGSTYDA